MAFELSPNLLRLSAGIPTAGLGGLLGYLTAPKKNRFEGMARGAGMGYMTGTGLGVGAMLGDAAAPPDASTTEKLPSMAAGSLAGGMLGLGVGRMLQGPPQWERQKKFREELMTALRTRHHRMRRELRQELLNTITGMPPIQKTGGNASSASNEPPVMEFAREHPGLMAIPVGGVMGATFARSGKRHPIIDLLRGATTGAVTGAGIAGGGALGRTVASDPVGGTLAGGALGGLLSYLIASNVLHDDNAHEKRSLSPALTALISAKQLSDKRDYHGKHRRLRALMSQYPDDFFVDSAQGNIVGITHKPTGFRIHAPMPVVPVTVKGHPNAQASVA